MSTWSISLREPLEDRFSKSKLASLSFGPFVPEPIWGLPWFSKTLPSPKSVNAAKFLKDSELFVLFKIYTSTLFIFTPEVTSGKDLNHLS